MKMMKKFALGMMTFLGVYVSSLTAAPVIYKLTDSSLGGEMDQIRGVTSALVQKFKEERQAAPRDG